MKVNILGVEYEVVFKTAEEDEKLIYSSGYTDQTIKKLIIRKYTEEELKDRYTVANPKYDIDRVIRGEIVHAFFYETGHMEYFNDEILVHLLAIQLPKIKDYMGDIDVKVL